MESPKQRNSDIGDAISKIKTMERRMAFLESSLEDQANSNRGLHVHMHGLLELTEGDDPIQILEIWLTQFLKLSFGHTFEIETGMGLPLPRAPLDS